MQSTNYYFSTSKRHLICLNFRKYLSKCSIATDTCKIYWRNYFCCWIKVLVVKLILSDLYLVGMNDSNILSAWTIPMIWISKIFQIQQGWYNQWIKEMLRWILSVIFSRSEILNLYWIYCLKFSVWAPTNLHLFQYLSLFPVFSISRSLSLSSLL